MTEQLPPSPETNHGPALEIDQRPLLRRSRDDKVIAGVAGGLGRSLGIDPVIIRIAFVLLVIGGGSGVLLYLIGVLAIPEERPGDPVHAAAARDSRTGIMLLGAVLIIAGGLMLADRVFPSFGLLIGPLIVVAIGVAVVVGARR